MDRFAPLRRCIGGMARLTPDRADQRFARRLLMVVVAAALVVFVVKASDLLLLTFGAVLGAVLLATVADWLDEHTPLPRWAGLLIATLLALAALWLMGWLFTSELSGQISQLRRQLPQDWAKLRATLGADPVGKLLLDAVTRIGQGSGIATVAASLGIGAGEVVVNFIIILIGAVFFAAQPDRYAAGAVMLAPPPYRGVVDDALRDTGRSLRLWLLTQLVSMTMMGLMIWGGLWWSGVPAAGSLGLLGGLSEFIPYVGPTLAMIPPIIVAAAGSGSLPGVLVTYAVVRVVQANIITPLISARVVEVPPALYLFLILSCGAAFGSFGLFFSGAISVAAYTLVLRLWLRETLGDDVAMPGED